MSLETLELFFSCDFQVDLCSHLQKNCQVDEGLTSVDRQYLQMMNKILFVFKEALVEHVHILRRFHIELQRVTCREMFCVR